MSSSLSEQQEEWEEHLYQGAVQGLMKEQEFELWKEINIFDNRVERLKKENEILTKENHDLKKILKMENFVLETEDSYMKDISEKPIEQQAYEKYLQSQCGKDGLELLLLVDKAIKQSDDRFKKNKQLKKENTYLKQLSKK